MKLVMALIVSNLDSIDTLPGKYSRLFFIGKVEVVYVPKYFASGNSIVVILLSSMCYSGAGIFLTTKLSLVIKKGRMALL